MTETIKQLAHIPAMPDGWNISRNGDGIIVQKDGIGGYVARQDADNIASEILYWLANDLLSALTPPAQNQKGAGHDGLVQMPIEPTPEILKAAYGHLYRLDTKLGRHEAELSYKAGIDAAPMLPAQAQNEDLVSEIEKLRDVLLHIRALPQHRAAMKLAQYYAEQAMGEPRHG